MMAKGQAVDSNFTFTNRNQPGQYFKQSRFSGSIGADERDADTLGNVE